MVIKVEKYYLIKDNKVYKIKIEKFEEEILIQYKNYKIRFQYKKLEKFTNIVYESIDEAYEYIIKVFELNSASIKEMAIYKYMILLLKIYINNEQKNIELLLPYYNDIDNNDMMMNSEELKKNFNNVLKDVTDLKNEVRNLKNEISNLTLLMGDLFSEKKKQILKEDMDDDEFISDPRNLEAPEDLIEDSYAYHDITNTFALFKSIKDIYYIIYSNKKKSIVFYDLVNKKKINEIENAHEKHINNLRYQFDKINKRDLILSISSEDNNVKLWDMDKMECILDMKKVNNVGKILSACFLDDNDQYYIITSNADYNKKSELMKVFDLKGRKIKQINDSNLLTYFVDTYYDKKLSKNYILTTHFGYVKSYDFTNNKTYHKYDDDEYSISTNVVINDNDNLVKLIESCDDGNIRIWDFHLGILLYKIDLKTKGLYGLCLWNKQYLFVGAKDKTFKLVNLNNSTVIKSFIGHENKVVTLKKIILPRYGECLISQGWNEDKIKISKFL